MLLFSVLIGSAKEKAKAVSEEVSEEVCSSSKDHKKVPEGGETPQKTCPQKEKACSRFDINLYKCGAEPRQYIQGWNFQKYKKVLY